LKNSKKVGITGGIGAGKSIVCRIFSAMGYPVFNSDHEAKRILNTQPAIKKAVVQLFGESAYLDNELNRSYIASEVFNDQNLLKKLNEIVHPAVRAAFADWAVEQNSPIVFNEAAILFETGMTKNYDAIILVTASETTRIKRVMKRDQISEKAVRQRMDKQWKDDRKIPLADFCVENNDEQMLIPQVLKIIDQLSNS
jgi:dephospho-CoA kinase